MTIRIKDGRDALWQWDTGREVELTESVDIVHFSNMPYGKAYAVNVENDTALIPDELLQSGANLFCFAFIGNVEDGYTTYSTVFEVQKKPKPEDYFFVPTEYITIQELDERIAALEEQGGGGAGEDGFSPIIEIELAENGHIVSVTDVNGTQSFTVMNGETPIKGEDYFTELDKAEIVGDVISALPVWNGGDY